MRNIALVVLTLLLISGCGGGSTENPESSDLANTNSTTLPQTEINTSNESDITITGKVIDGEISGATVFLDLNLNDELDSDEPITRSKEDGSYEVNTKYEKSVIKVRKIARAFQLEKEKALEAGIPKAKKMYQMGTKYYHSGQYEEAAACFMNAAELAEYRMAYYSLALMYFKGQGVDQSFEEALYYARKALVKGAVIAQELEQEILEAMNA